MSAPRFFCDQLPHIGQHLTLPQPLAHHALRVLRLGQGADMVLFDGRGGQVAARLVLEGGAARARVLRHDDREAELRGRVTLVQGLASGDKMDWIVEKAVEVGATAVQPIAAQRSVLRLSGARLDKRWQHWQRIVQSASEQCGRNRLMEVARVATLATYLEGLRDNAQHHQSQQTQHHELPGGGHSGQTLLLCCDPDAPDRLADVLSQIRPNDAASCAAPHVVVLVGPEGGWSPQEQDCARAHGAVPVRFGPRILRTETAGIALISAITALLDW